MEIIKIDSQNSKSFTQLISEGELHLHEGSFYLKETCTKSGSTPIIYKITLEKTDVSEETFDKMETPTY